MNTATIRNIIFDLDGTLINSSGDVLFCLQYAYSTVPSLAQVRPDASVIGPPLPELIRNVTPDITGEQALAVTRAFRACYDNSTYERTTLQPGAEDLLSHLKECHIRRFIATNKPRLATLQILEAKQIDCFDGVVTLDLFDGNKMDKAAMIEYIITTWSLKREETLMVGDDASDILAATRNQIPSAAIMNGYGDKTRIREAEPSYMFQTLGEFCSYMRSL